jgi:hypothetical protein
MPFLLDADTLQTIPNPRPSDVAWSPEGNRLFPEDRASGAGVFDSDGHWVTMDLNSSSRDRVLWTFLNVPHQDSGGWAPKELRVFSTSGQVVWIVKTRDRFTGFASNGRLLAAAIYNDQANPFDLDLAPIPIRIAIHDLHEKVERCSIPTTLPSLYGVSSGGSVAVTQGSVLSLYEP